MCKKKYLLRDELKEIKLTIEVLLKTRNTLKRSTQPSNSIL